MLSVIDRRHNLGELLTECAVKELYVRDDFSWLYGVNFLGIHVTPETDQDTVYKGVTEILGETKMYFGKGELNPMWRPLKLVWRKGTWLDYGET